MKVDKAVCTTDTMTDVESAISYENLLSSLVQKKILAIKRECEAKKVAKQRRKQQNCLGSLIFGSRHDRSNRYGDSSSKEAEIDSQSIGQQESEIVIDSKEIMNKDAIVANIRHDNQEPVNSITNIHVNEIPLTKTENILTECHIDVLNERGSCNNDNNTTQRHDPLHSHSVNEKYSRRCMESGDDQNAYSTHSKINDNIVIKVDVESASVAATNRKCPRIVSQIEVNDGMNSQKLRTRKKSCDSISVPSSVKRTTLSEPVDEMALLDYKQRYQMYLLEAKSISGQCSPILAQRQTFNVSASGRAIKSPLTQKMVFDTSDDSVTVANVPTSPRSGTSNENNQCKENIDGTDECCSSQVKSTTTMTTTKRNSKTFFKKKDKISNANNEVHGFISSFNQLTSKNLAVITSNTKTTLKHITSNKCERGNHCTVDYSDDISAVSNKKATQDYSHSTYKRTHRCSEPMLVYPSSNRLQQCILSMPPTQPIQLRYNDELMYDVSLKVEADRNTDFTGDRRRRHRKHRHRHHHHHHHNNGRKNRHKRKILLHDLDEQTVKVIDPEDMSQRARFTIIATALLLLLMCLVLVGVTLRMAPLIDDMVRQENERIQESINRGKYMRNMTHAAFIGQQYQQQSQHP